MSEDIKQEEVVEQEDTTQQDDAAFEAGYAEARGEEPPTQPEPEQQEPEQEPVVEEAPEPEPIFAGLTEDQLKSALAKAGEVDELKSQVRQIFGRLGEFNQRIQQAQSATGGAKLTAGQLNKLRSEFPEMADLLEQDLSGLSVGGQQNSFDPTPMRDELQQGFRAEIDRVNKENEKKLLSIRHRDWQTIRDTDDFKLWENTLPVEDRQSLNESWDAMYIADRFDEFKAWRSKAQSSKQQKQSRLAAAVTPRGVQSQPTSTVNDDDAFMAGYKSVRGG